MKRTLIILFSVLVGVFIIFTALDSKGNYTAEKALHKINVQFGKIKSDRLATPEASFSALIEQYKKFMGKYPKSRLAPLAHLMIARTFMLKNDYVSAREVYERINQQYAKEVPGMAAQALTEIAVSYADQDNFTQVQKTYERLIRDYATTELGLNAPITMAKLQAKRDPAGASRYFDDAIMHYRSLMQKYPKTLLEFKALNYIASTLTAQGKWNEAINVYAELLSNYAETKYLNGEIASVYVRTINSLAVFKLGDFDRPIKIYEQFIAKYPQHPLNATLEKMIQGIKEIKQEQLEKAGSAKEN